MIQKQFADSLVQKIKGDSSIIGLAAGGSWITNEMDEFSDLDLILVTREKVSDNPEKMLSYARQFGDLLVGFTGEHVGEPRLLICLYKNPLLHVDIKFLIPDELDRRVEDPVILLDKDGILEAALKKSEAKFPYPDYQWIEDRFWVWIHYALLKVGRGEYLEALDFLTYLRMVVFGPLLHIKNGKLPKGVRKVERLLPDNDLNYLASTIPDYDKEAIIKALDVSVALYKDLRNDLFDVSVRLNKEAEREVIQFLKDMRS